MSSTAAQTPHDLSDFVDFLRQIDAEGFEIAVIGGMAVAAYADLLNESVRSVDLDLYATWTTLEDLLHWAPRHGIQVLKRPQPRNIPVAFLQYGDKEINVLTDTHGLPAPEVVTRNARLFTLADHDDFEIPIADPFDLLANKLAVRREKDEPHIAILQRFVEQEMVAIFMSEDRPRVRFAPVRRLLDVLGRKTIPEKLLERLFKSAKQPADFRFLMGRAPTSASADRLLKWAQSQGGELYAELEAIRSSRKFDES